MVKAKVKSFNSRKNNAHPIQWNRKKKPFYSIQSMENDKHILIFINIFESAHYNRLAPTGDTLQSIKQLIKQN